MKTPADKNIRLYSVLVDQRAVWIDFLIIELAVLVFDRVDDVLPTLQGQLDPELRPPVPALHHGLHLAGLDHTGPLSLQSLEGVLDVLVVDAAAAVVNQDGPEAQLIGVVRCGG